MNSKKTTKAIGLVVLLLLSAVIYSGYKFYELLQWKWEPPAPSQMPIEAGLMDMSARYQPSLGEVEEEFSLDAPIALKAPTTTDPIWRFVYDYQGQVLELGAFDDKDPEIITIENRRRDTIRFNGFFTLRTPEEAAADDGYSTHEYPTAGGSLPNRYTEFLKAYDMRTPISIKDLEMAMELPDPCNVAPPFKDPMWFFFYESPDERCIIRLYGLDQRPDDDRDVEGGDLFVPREKFLFTGYWVVGCREPEPTPTPTPEAVVERIKTWIFGE